MPPESESARQSRFVIMGIIPETPKFCRGDDPQDPAANFDVRSHTTFSKKLNSKNNTKTRIILTKSG